jgi:hypothetical protein
MMIVLIDVLFGRFGHKRARYDKMQRKSAYAEECIKITLRPKKILVSLNFQKKKNLIKIKKNKQVVHAFLALQINSHFFSSITAANHVNIVNHNNYFE